MQQQYQFTRRQAKHFTPAEYVHYAELGLIKGVPRHAAHVALALEAPTLAEYEALEAQVEELQAEVSDLREQLTDE